jgi:hypothetical protein
MAISNSEEASDTCLNKREAGTGKKVSNNFFFIDFGITGITLLLLDLHVNMCDSINF